MDEQKVIILSILKNFLGSPKSESNFDNRDQWEFNCPSQKCIHDVNKYNLAFNSKNNIYKCWKCKEHGVVHKLVNNYGTREDRNKLKLILPHYINNYINVFNIKTDNNDFITCPLPEGFTFITKDVKSPMHKLALNYMLEDRKLTFDELIYYKIGFTEIGPYKNRIVIPSFNKNNKINYFDTRTFLEKVKVKYYKPDKKHFPNVNIPNKYDIIFNEKNINWDLPVYLVEGVFDMFRIPNSIPLLGKTFSLNLLYKLIQNKSTVIICLDDDAVNDGIELYDYLLSFNLNVYFVSLKNLGDISYQYETGGREAIKKILLNKIKIDDFFKFYKILNYENSALV